MIVRFATGLRKAGLTVEQFQRHWRGPHAEVVLELEGLTAYVQNHLVLRGDGAPWLPWPATDACAEIEFATVEAMDAAFASPAAGPVRADSALFIEPGRGGLTLCHRRVLSAGRRPDHGVKLVTALRRFPGCDPGRFVEVLADAYAAAVAEARPLHHEQLVRLPHLAADEGAFCDAVDLLWFPDAATAARYAVSDVAGRATCALTGVAFGAERLVAAPVTIR